MKKKKSKEKPPASFRLDPEKLARVRAKEINVTGLIDSLLDDILNESKCPTCRQTIKNK